MRESGNTQPKKRDDLLHTKLLPPRLHASTIQRADLLARLDEGLSRKLILVSAPTGFGKTTLVGSWIKKRGFPSAWLTLDAYDNDPTRFWTYAISALRSFDPAIGKTSLASLSAPNPPAFQHLLTPLINDLAALAGPCVLVLDDFHLLTSPETLAGLTFFIQHLPEPLHLLLTSRSDPDLPLAILRVRDELVEIHSEQLRFNRQESEAFLRASLQADFSAGVVDRLLARTRGWPAGLRLMVFSLQNNRSGEIEDFAASFSGNDRYMSDYLTQEVVDSQPEAIQSFLLKTSFLDRLTGSLCDALTAEQNGSATLEQLERENLFLEQLDTVGDHIWYRYNPLFAESIQYLARQRLPEADIRSLFSRASAWYENQQLYEQAIEAALAARLNQRAMLLIEKFIEIHDISELFTLFRWLEQIPEREIYRHPAICLAYAQVILYTSDRFAPATAVKVEPLLQAAQTAWVADEDQQGLGELLSFRGMAAQWQGDFQKAYEYAAQSLDKLPEYDVLWRGVSLLIIVQEDLNAGRIFEAQNKVLEARALLGAAQNIFGVLAALQSLSQTYFWQGDLDAAEQLNQQILREAVGDISMLDDQAIASLNLARIAYERDELEKAAQFARRALDLSQQRANQILAVQAATFLARVLAAQDELLQAVELVNSLAAQVRKPASLREIQETQAALAIQTAEFSILESWRTSLENKAQNILPVQSEREAFTLARFLVETGDHEAALQTLNGWKADAAENGRIRSQIEALCLESLAYYAMTDLQRARPGLIQALKLGRARGFRRLFVDLGMKFGELLQELLPTLSERPLRLYTAALLQSFAAQASTPSRPAEMAVLIEPLSDQEIRVLRLIAAGMSNAEVARELIISINTVKTHVKNIYRKLSVNSRAEARQVARELKLL